MKLAWARHEAEVLGVNNPGQFVKGCIDSPLWNNNVQQTWDHVLWHAPPTEIKNDDLGDMNELKRNFVKLGRHAKLIGNRTFAAVKDWRGFRVDHWYTNIWREFTESYFWGHVGALGSVGWGIFELVTRFV